ncbi:MAG: aldo/keto reductase [Spirochaetes bacterium RBG_13_68_11]|nr:MAG: aldo/keto reductase [Spirochaetes bacterium RBG_13_68_11]
MNYRLFGRTGWRVSALGLGCMRLPTLGASENVDEPEAIRLIRRAVDGGVNYVDSAHGYHGGRSEVVLGMALADGYRQRVKLVTKMPTWHVKEAGDFDRLLDEQLGRLKTDHLDLYLVHSLDKDSWHKVRDLGVREWAEKAMASGRFERFGFSFHDEYPVFTEIVDAYDGWTACMVMYNYMNADARPGRKGVEYAAQKGLAVAVMEPVFGGNLASPPPSIRRIMDGGPVKRTPVDWALQWVWNQPEVSIVLSGMSTVAQVDENLASASRSGPGALSADEVRLIEKVAAAFTGLQPIPCTSCKYCMPCPSGVNIPHNLSMYNQAVMYDRLADSRRRYADTKPAERASACTDCEQCEEKCPQKITISDWMPRIDRELGTGAPESKGS